MPTLYRSDEKTEIFFTQDYILHSLYSAVCTLEIFEIILSYYRLYFAVDKRTTNMEDCSTKENWSRVRLPQWYEIFKVG